MAFVKYITGEDDRWDQIALAHYGDPYAYRGIVDANPTAPIAPLLPAGIELAIPVLPQATANAASLPPWKR